MKALILAAGEGKRLTPITNSIPKALVEVNGTPLLVNALNILQDIGIDKVVIVVGHLRCKIVEEIGFNFNGLDITYVTNEKYNSTNNIYSLWLARDYLDDDILMLECDLYYRKNIVIELLKSKAECSILTSDFNPITMDGTLVAVNDQLHAKSLIVKKNQTIEGNQAKNYKKTVNIYKLSKEFLLNEYLPLIDLYVKCQDIDSYYEFVLGALIYWGNSDIKVVNILEDSWCEIDDLEDLKIAEDKFKI